MEKDIKIFGDFYLDTDSDPKVSKGSDYVLNTIIQSDGRFGVAVNIKGNELITNDSLLSSVFPDIHTSNPNPVYIAGSCKDEARNRIIYFACNNISDSHTEYDSAIFYLDLTTSDIVISNKLVLHAEYLNFDNLTKVVAQIIGDLLYFTDGVNPPRKINYIKAYNMTNSLNPDYQYKVLNADLIEAYKRPPSTKITGGPGTSIYATKVIPNKIYQFAYRYVYQDYEKSVLSPFSDVMFSDVQQFADGSGTLYSSAYAIFLYFKSTLKASGVLTDIDSVELFVRNSDIGNWYLYDKINAPKVLTVTMTYYSAGSYDNGSGIVTANTRGTVSQDTYNKISIGQSVTYSSNTYYITEKFTSGAIYIIGLDTTVSGTGWTRDFTVNEDFKYIFKDDKIKQSVDQVDLARPYDFLPILAKTQEIIEKDKLIYADITEGFDNVDVNVSTSVIITNVAYSTNVVSYNITSGTPIQWYRLAFTSYPYPTLYCVVVKVVVYASDYTTTHTATNTFYTAFYTSKSGDTSQTILNTLRSNLVSRGISSTVISVVNVSGTYYLQLLTALPGSAIVYQYTYESIATTNLNSTYKTLKDNDSYLGSIVYYDKNLRYSFVQKFGSEITTSSLTNLSNMASLVCSIKNKPPVWAYYYSLNFTKRTKSDKFIRLYFKTSYTTINQLSKIYNTYAYFDQSDNFLRIQVNRLINDSVDINANLKLAGYTFNEGDRIRLLGNNTTICNYDLKIKGVEWPKTNDRYQQDYATTPAYILDNAGNKINNPFSEVVIIQVTRLDVPLITTVNTASSLTGSVDFWVVSQELTFEIYSPKKESSNPFYFPNYFGTIGNPGTANNYHVGVTQNQNPSAPVATPAIVPCNPGDTYLKLRFAKFFYPTYDDNYSDYYESNSFGLGMPNIFNPDSKQSELTSGMRYSGSLLEDTKINKLNQFLSADLEILKSKFGPIQTMKEVGNVLKILQDKKETSIYISRTEMQNADNTSNVVKSTALLGTANLLDEDRGTIFPRSVVPHNREMYYWDYYRAEVIRSSANGQYPISEYGMRTYFKSIAALIKSSGVTSCDVIGSFDEENKMYLLTFLFPDSTNNVTVGFYDPQIEGIKPRWISFFSFIPDHYEFIGTSLVSFKNGAGYRHNSANVNRCTFYGVKYKQQINWYSNALPIIKKVFRVLGLKSNKAWNIPYLIIEPDATYTKGMQSLLKTNHFELKEGEFTASYLNNMKTTSNNASVLDLINGDSLRGYALKHQMENLENVECWIMEVSVGYDVSNYY